MEPSWAVASLAEGGVVGAYVIVVGWDGGVGVSSWIVSMRGVVGFVEQGVLLLLELGLALMGEDEKVRLNRRDV